VRRFVSFGILSGMLIIYLPDSTGNGIRPGTVHRTATSPRGRPLSLAQAADGLACSISTPSCIERSHSSNRQKITTYQDFLHDHPNAA
jgi:hypothetical protein